MLSYNTYNSSNVVNGNSIGFINTLKNIVGLFEDTVEIIADSVEDTIGINKDVDAVLHEVSDTIDNIGKKKEVFNIDLNAFNYEEAGEVCKALDSELATFDHLLEAHNDGAEWCNYGWSANQMALYPTQKDTWDKLQKKKHKNKCGKPGVNGGYFKDTNLKLGVNCYGYKPDPHKEQIIYFNGGKNKKTDSNELTIDTNTIQIRPFNDNKWSKYSFKKSSYIINPSDYNMDVDKKIVISSNLKNEDKDPNTYIS